MEPRDLIKQLQKIEEISFENEYDITSGLCYQEISEQIKNAKLKQNELINELLHSFYRYQLIHSELGMYKFKIDKLNGFKF